MGRPKAKDKNLAIEWARGILRNPNKYLILDSETTGLGKRDLIIQLGIIDLEGNTIFDSLVRPTSRKTISKDATGVHGITMGMLKDAPTFPEIYPQLRNMIKTKEFVIYNARFDTNMLVQTSVLEGNKEDFKVNAQCAMLAYSMFVGEWSEYHGNYKYQKLPKGDHTAIWDCLATLNLISVMAQTDLVEIPRKWWHFWN